MNAFTNQHEFAPILVVITGILILIYKQNFTFGMKSSKLFLTVTQKYVPSHTFIQRPLKIPAAFKYK